MSSEQVKSQLAEAKALIQQKRYADARKALKRIDDPLARQWETKLDSIAPASSPAATTSILNYVIVGVGAGIIGLVIGFLIGSTLGSRTSTPATDYSKITEVKAALMSYCDIMKLTPYCDSWTDGVMSNNLETARQCLTRIDWNTNIEPFGQCLLDNNVQLYITPTVSSAQLTTTAILATNDAVSGFLNATSTASVNMALTATAQAPQ